MNRIAFSAVIAGLLLVSGCDKADVQQETPVQAATVTQTATRPAQPAQTTQQAPATQPAQTTKPQQQQPAQPAQTTAQPAKLVQQGTQQTVTKEPEPEPVAEEPEPPVEQPAPVAQEQTPVAEPEEKTEAQLEYERSIGGVAQISQQTFEEDKAIILAKIEELDQILRTRNYNKWVPYLDKESVAYWSNQRNLNNISSKLPVKGLKLSSLKDYFENVFVGSRVGRTVDEIRYLTDTDGDAVQVRDGVDVVYYTFRKVDGEWKLHLRTLEEM